MNDLENKIGDQSAAPIIAMPHKLAVRVARRGTLVTVAIGNADAVELKWQDAMRQGYAWAKEGRKAKVEKRPAELRLGLGRLHCSGETLVQIGGWLMAKAAEAKLLAGAIGTRIEM